MITFFISLIDFVAQLLTILIIVNSLLSFVLPPYHNARQLTDRIVNPLLKPIRRFVPPVQMVDFSPVILIILIQLVDWILVRILVSIY